MVTFPAAASVIATERGPLLATALPKFSSLST
jgi:hypothetical protein